MKVRALPGAWVALSERLKPLANVAVPDRELLWGDAAGNVTARYQPPSGWIVVDFAEHPSGAVTAVLSDVDAALVDRKGKLRLVRLDAVGRTVGSSDFDDPSVKDDPTEDPITQFHESMITRGTLDAVRLSPASEDLVMALRSGTNAVIVYRLDYDGVAGFTQRWRTLVEPGVQIIFLGITSGTFDPFGSLDHQWRVYLDTDADGRVAVAVSTRLTGIGAAHADYFHEPVNPDLWAGALMTRLDPDGRRLGTVVLETQSPDGATKYLSELLGLRFLPDSSVALLGRLKTPAKATDPGGWDAYISIVRPATTQTAPFEIVDVDQGDVFFDLAQLSDGRLFVTGATHYTQNPSGGSISEEAEPLAAMLSSTGTFTERVPIPVGPRHNQLRSVTPWRDHHLVAGLEDGPGTHSADDPTNGVNLALLRSNGVLHEVRP